MTVRSVEMLQQFGRKGMVQVRRLLGMLFLIGISMVCATPVYAATSASGAAAGAAINKMETQPLASAECTF